MPHYCLIDRRPALLTRLEARRPLLTGGARDAPERQRALRDTIAWSHQLVGPEARILFHRLGVFAAGWTLEAAEAVGNSAGDLDVLNGLASLADSSLSRLDESGAEPRYTMLETIREYARDQLAASGDESTLREAHATYFLRLAQQAEPHLSAAGQGAWLRRLEADHPNFRLALEMLVASDDHDAHLRRRRIARKRSLASVGLSPAREMLPRGNRGCASPWRSHGRSASRRCSVRRSSSWVRRSNMRATSRGPLRSTRRPSRSRAN